MIAGGGVEDVLADDRDRTWRPAYATVAGFLPPAEWHAPAVRRLPIALARTQIQATTGGPVRLAIDDARGLSFYLDGRRVEPADGLWLDLAPGVHTIAVAIPTDRREGIRSILEDVPGSPARRRSSSGDEPR